MTKKERAEYDRMYYAKNKEKIRKRKKEWRDNNPEKSRQNSREWAANNREAARKRTAKWTAKDPMKSAYSSKRRSAKFHKIPFEITYEEFEEIWISSGHWEERGRGSNKYVMARIKTVKGVDYHDIYNGEPISYQIDSVRIITMKKNSQGMQSRRQARRLDQSYDIKSEPC